MPRMNAERKAEWVAALRSGEFTQGRGSLAFTTATGNTTYCCLGVLCELAHRAGVAIEVNTNLSGMVVYGGSDLVLPPQVQRWAGLDSMNPPGMPADGHAYTLAELNDGVSHKDVRPRDFLEIADIIEREL